MKKPAKQTKKPAARKPSNMTSEALIGLAAAKGFRSVIVEKGRDDKPAASLRPARVRKPPKPDNIPF